MSHVALLNVASTTTHAACVVVDCGLYKTACTAVVKVTTPSTASGQQQPAEQPAGTKPPCQMKIPNTLTHPQTRLHSSVGLCGTGSRATYCTVMHKIPVTSFQQPLLSSR